MAAATTSTTGTEVESEQQSYRRTYEEQVRSNLTDEEWGFLVRRAATKTLARLAVGYTRDRHTALFAASDDVMESYIDSAFDINSGEDDVRAAAYAESVNVLALDLFERTLDTFSGSDWEELERDVIEDIKTILDPVQTDLYDI